MGMYAVIAIIAYHLFIDGINPTDNSVFYFLGMHLTSNPGWVWSVVHSNRDLTAACLDT
jgi:hypothetical protein